MRRERTRFVFAERKRQTVKELIGAVPDITMRTNVEIRVESLRVAKPDGAVYTVGADEQIGIVS